MNTISIIIAVYNRTHLLERAIKSVYQQGFDEIIVINGGANQEASAIIESIVYKYPKIIYRRYENNIGFSGAKNEGVKIATSEWIGFLDDDDYYFCEFTTQLKHFIDEHSEYDIIHHRILDKAPHRSSYWGSKNFTQAQLEQGNQIPGSSFFKKSLYNKIG
jgi:glycosyltransferase involved in cell wall biosynthesis